MNSKSVRPSLLYPENRKVRLNESTFREPGAIYRGTPFWAWNNRLDRSQLLRQIECFRRMGYGGFHMHARTGLATPYLSDEFLAIIRICTEKAEEEGMKAWLYDEDRWPSGFGGGRVTEDPQHRMKYLLFTRHPYGYGARPTPNISGARAGREENGRLLARYSVGLKDGCLNHYVRLGENEPARRGAGIWYAYLESAGGVAWFNHQTYVDTLSPAATRRFIETTHERYQGVVGDFFGGVIPAIFTDEPQHVFKHTLAHPAADSDLKIPFTGDFLETYRQRFECDLLDRLPEIFWELPDGRASVARYRYHDHVTERFADGFAATLGQWCERHGLMLTGHMMEEPTLLSQTQAIGEAMRSLSHFQLPGIDILCDRCELTTAKQAQSIAHQYGRPGVLSELYGATGWHYDFVGHKAHGDWQAALGVTIRVPHLAWVSMKGEAKRDFPASIHYQSPWCDEYKLIEDHFARVNSVLTRGQAIVRVGVIHPIESYWLCFGPVSQTLAERAEREQAFAELPAWLLGGLIDFDYLCEALLPNQMVKTHVHRLTVGQAEYAAIIVPAQRTIRATTLSYLEQFARAGGVVIFAGEIPSLVDAVPSTRARMLARRVIRCAWNRRALLATLESFREVDCLDCTGARCEGLLSQLRRDRAERHLFLCHTDREQPLEDACLALRGTWRVFERHTHNGVVTERAASHREGRTWVNISLPAHGHLLLTLRPGRSTLKTALPQATWTDVSELPDPVAITLSEPNALLLDQAEWKWDDGAWEAREEVLRIGNTVRVRCGLPASDGQGAQPWTDAGPAKPLGRIALRFRVQSEVLIASPELALEEPDQWTITWDGIPVEVSDQGPWVDDAIRRITLPVMSAGVHELALVRNYTHQTALEWFYLLGDFGVDVAGRHARIIAPVRTLAFGDWTRQGLPFYAGNVTYRCPVTTKRTERRSLGVQFPSFGGPVLRVTVDQRKTGPVAFAPRRFEIGTLAAGSHTIDVIVYGNRHNAFGPLHRIDPQMPWVVPNSWRSQGDKWAYEYQLMPMGLLVAPRLQARSQPALLRRRRH